MQVTVRTLDSQSHNFEIDDEVAQDLTVIGFKEFIEMDVGIRADKQRLIFKGKVLQDDNTLVSYGVFGNVIHLVQRTPPSDLRNASRTTSGETPSTSTQTTSTTSNGTSNIYIGGIFGSGDVNHITQQLVENLLSTFGAGTQANVITSTSNNGSMLDVQIALQAGSTQANAASEARKRLKQANHFMSDASKVLKEGVVQNSANVEGSNESEPSVEENMEASNTPEALADVLDRLLEFNRDFQPLLVRYRDLLRGNSEFQSGSDDHVPDEVAEILHNLSHSYHALSDLSVNLQVPQPRSLICYPRLSPLDMPMNIPFSTSTPSTTVNGLLSGSGTRPTFSTTTASHQATASSLQQGISTSSSPMASVASSTAGSPISVPISSGNPASTSMPSMNVWTAAGHGTTVQHTVVGIMPTPLGEIPVSLPDPNPSSAQANSNENEATPRASTSAPTSTSQSSATTATPSGVTQGPHVSFQTSSSRPFSNFGQGRPQGVILPVLQSIRVATAPMPGFRTAPVRPTVTAASTESSPTVASSTTNSTPSFHFPSLPVPGMNTMNHHPDPLLPCQSFHFGPSFQQWRPQTFPPVNFSRIVGSTRPRTDPGAAAPPSAHERDSPGTSSTAATGSLSGGVSAGRPFMEPFRSSANQGPRGFPGPSNFVNPLHDLTTLLLLGTDHSIRGLVNFMVGDDDTDEDGILRDFYDSVIAPISVWELIGIFSGTSLEGFRESHAPLLAFVERNFNDRRKLIHSNVKAVVSRICTHLRPFVEDLAQKLEVKDDDVDLSATLLGIVRRIVEDGVRGLLGDQDKFGQRLVDIYYKYLRIIYGVTEMYTKGGFQRLCELFFDFGTPPPSAHHPFRHPADVDVFYSRLGTFTSTFLVPKMRAVACQRPLGRSEADLYVVRHSQKPREDFAAGEPAGTIHMNDSASQNANESHLKAPHRIDIDKIWAERTGAWLGEDTAEMETEDTARPEEWNRHVPRDWIPVINRDIKRQRGGCPWHAPSDAYLSGLPSKRRKALKPCSNEDVDVLDLLQESVAQARVIPETSVSEIVKESKECNLAQSFHRQVRDDVRQRLDNDPEYDPKHFPKSEEHFRSGSDQGS